MKIVVDGITYLGDEYSDGWYFQYEDGEPAFWARLDVSGEYWDYAWWEDEQQCLGEIECSPHAGNFTDEQEFFTWVAATGVDQ